MRAAASFFSPFKKRREATHASLSSFASFTSLAFAAAAAASASRLSVSTRKSSMVRNLDSSRDLSCFCFGFVFFNKRKKIYFSA